MKNLIRHIEIISTGAEGLPVIIRQGREITIYIEATTEQIQSVLGQR